MELIPDNLSFQRNAQLTSWAAVERPVRVAGLVAGDLPVLLAGARHPVIPGHLAQ